ncbi:MAG: hypothetical protein IT162_02490 [Bryobacterales bacterium]|nr:hypothetical protein [Bryobacterales bacterium]
MQRFIAILTLSAAALSAQQKKIVVGPGQTPDVIKDWQSASNKVRLVEATKENTLQELADADAYIGGDISPQMVRAGKNL